MDKEYYKKRFMEKWDALYADAENNAENNDPGYTATMEFEECCNADEVVGYYLVYHKDSTLKDWLDNTADVKMTEQDKEVDRILKELFKEDE